MIRSKLHTVLEAAKAQKSNTYDRFQKDPLFLFADETVNVLTSDQALRSIRELIKLDLLHLPYPSMTVQFTRPDAKSGTWVVSLREVDNKFYAIPVFVSGGGVIFPRDEVIASPMAEYDPSSEEIENTRKVFEELGEKYENRGNEPGMSVNCHRDDRGYAPFIASGAVCMAAIMTHVSGLQREVVDAPEKLNARRERRGGEKVRGYQYVTIGHVMDREGKSHKYDGSTETGRRMPIHMRAGHVRQQFYGEGRALRRPVWIPPVLVNYHGDKDVVAPVVEKRVVL